MALITTSTQSATFQYASQSYLDRSPLTGNLVVVLRKTSGALSIWTSSNNGTTWTDAAIDFTRSNLQEWSNVFVDTAGYLHLAYRVYESGKDRIFYKRAGANASGVLTWDSEVLVAEATAGSAGAIYTGVSMIAIRDEFDDTYVHFAVGTTSGANNGVSMFTMQIYVYYPWWGGNPTTVYDMENSLIAGTRQWLNTGSGRITPSLDFRHTGDAHTTTQPDLWVAWGSGQIYMTKISWASNRWNGSTSLSVATPSSAMTHVPARFDGTRFLTCVINSATVNVYERDVSNTTTTLRTSPAHTTGNITHLAINYEPTTGDFRLYALGTSTAVLYYVDYIRATNAWGTWQSTGTTIVGNGFGTRRSAYGNARYNYYTVSGSSPYNLTSTSQTLVFAPNTPVITAPASGLAQRTDAGLTLTWTFSDTDTEDTQDSYAIERRKGAASPEYWQASTSTWVASEVQNTSGTSSVTFASGWGADADDTHVYKVKVWDSTGLPSSYSAGVSVIPSTRVNPTIATPVDASIVTSNAVTVTWTVAQQTAFRVRLYIDPGAVLIHDSGWVTSTATTYQPPYVLLDNTTYEVSVVTKNNEGLDSATDTNVFNVDFVEPPVPTLAVAGLDSLGVVRLNVTNPAPVGSEPALTHNDLWRRIATGVTPSPVTSYPLQDTFTGRTEVNEWGDTETGQTWAHIGTAADFNVAGGVGTVLMSVVNSTRYCTVTNVNRKSFRLDFQAALGLVPTGAVIETFGLLRFTDANNHYRCRFRWQTDGSMRLQIDKRIAGVSTTLVTLTPVVGLTMLAGTVVRCACEITDAGVIGMKIWRTVDAEPGAYQLTTTNNDIPFGNGTGMACIRSTGNTDAAATYTFDDIIVSAVDMVGNTDLGTRVATGRPENDQYDDFTALSGVEYEYQAVAHAVNGTSSPSAWVS